MSEGIIVRRTSGINNEIINQIINDYINSQRPGTNLFTENGTFVAPKTGEYAVVCFGGGGGGGGTSWANYIINKEADRYCTMYRAYGGGGGSGYFNSGNFNLNKGEEISIIVGSGGAGGSEKYCGRDDTGVPNGTASRGGTGGTSTFGIYLSATGGQGGGGGSSQNKQSRPSYQTAESDIGVTPGSGGIGYHNGNTGYAVVYNFRSRNYRSIYYETGGSGVGGTGCTPPYDYSQGNYGKGGSSGQIGAAGCVYVSWS